MSTDPRYRTKLWLETYDTPANITKDDDSTQASIIYQFEKPPYPLTRVFFDPKNVDGIVTINTPSTTALTDWKHEAYAYNEQVPIDLSCVTKQGITGDKLRWKMELDLRNIIETYPLGSVRSLNRETSQDLDQGTWKLHTVRYNLDYKRAITDYTSDCTLLYGTGWQYDGDRVDNGVEGQWGNGSTTVDSDGGSTVTQNINTNPGALTFDLTVFVGDAYSENATNLGLSTSTYTKIKFKYKTTGNATAKIVATFSDAATQTVLSETSSTTWAVGTVTLTTAKTLDHIALYICDGVGTVQYDWIKVYKNDFTIPNVVDVNFNPMSRNVDLGIPSGLGIGMQSLGSPPTSIELTCDLDIETSSTAGATGCWQLASGDDNDEIFLYVQHENDYSGYWSWLTWGNKAARVVIDSVQTDKSGICKVMLHEKADINAPTYTERWNL